MSTDFTFFHVFFGFVKICHVNVCNLRKKWERNYSTGIIKRNYRFCAVVCPPFYRSNNGHNGNEKKNVYKIMSSEKMSIKLHILQFSVVEVCQQDYYFRKNTIFSTCHNVMIWIEWQFLWFHTIIMNGCWWSWENVSRLNSKRWLLCSKFICQMHQFLSLIHVQLNHKPLMPIFTI